MFLLGQGSYETCAENVCFQIPANVLSSFSLETLLPFSFWKVGFPNIRACTHTHTPLPFSISLPTPFIECTAFGRYFLRLGPLQVYVVKVMRENSHEATYIQRTFEEFQELHNKLRLLFPSSLLPRYLPPFLSAQGDPGEGDGREGGQDCCLVFLA